MAPTPPGARARAGPRPAEPGEPPRPLVRHRLQPLRRRVLPPRRRAGALAAGASTGAARPPSARSRSRSPHGSPTAGACAGAGSPRSGVCHARGASAECLLVLRSSLEEDFGVDSWNLRAAPSREAPVVGALGVGEGVRVLSCTLDGEWFKVAAERRAQGQDVVAFAARFFRDPVGGRGLEAFVSASAPELSGAAAATGRLEGGELVKALLRDLVALRRRYEQPPPGGRGDGERARVSRRLEDVLSRLEFLGVPASEAVDGEGPMLLLLLLRARSLPHRDFANPEAVTCWLSCLFQSLWHSVVFHAAFETYLSPPRCQAGAGEKLLSAMQATWAAYKREAEAVVCIDSDGSGEEAPPRLVPARELAAAFGDGYGDMSEALASIQNELSGSPSPAARAVADLVALIPLPTLDQWPTPAMAWQQAEEWQLESTPLLAVDLSLPQVTRASSRRLAQLWCPAGAGASDLGPDHRLVALVCYQWSFRHYVAFCRRQRSPSRCLLFNDLPGLTRGAPRELEWDQVPALCHRHSLTPRLALYESLAAAERHARGLLRRPHAGPPASAAAGGGGLPSQGQVGGGGAEPAPPQPCPVQ